MKVERVTPNKSGKLETDVVAVSGDTDYILNGIVYKHSPSRSVIIAEQADLDDLSDYEVGTIAYTAGFVNMWQLDANGEWVVII